MPANNGRQQGWSGVSMNLARTAADDLPIEDGVRVDSAIPGIDRSQG